MATDAALNDLLVLDLTDGVAGAYTGKLLADLGARVIMVEPPDGVALRRHPPSGGRRPLRRPVRPPQRRQGIAHPQRRR